MTKQEKAVVEAAIEWNRFHQQYCKCGLAKAVSALLASRQAGKGRKK